MLNTSYIVASALTPQVGSCTTNGNGPNLPFTNDRTNIGNHDAAGNARWDGATTYAFDAENRITSSTRTVGSLTTAVNYKYDGDGRRVRLEVTGGASTNFVYDAGGKLLAEYNSQNYPESGTRFRIGDHLGSTRLLFDLSGNVLQRFDYLPFGEELLTSNRTTALKYGIASIVKQRFTGQMRDSETNLDYFNARYLSPNQGRFMSIDPANAGARKDTPQSWNAYSYTINSPLLYVDPSGLSYAICQTNAPCQTVEGDRNALEEFMNANPNLYLANGNIYKRVDGGSFALNGAYTEVETSADGKLSPAAQKFFTDNQGRWNTTAKVVNAAAVGTAVVVTAGLSLEAVGTFQALPSMEVAIGRFVGSPHVAFRAAGGQWLHGVRLGGPGVGIVEAGATRFAESAFRFSVKVLYPAAVSATAGSTAGNCLYGAFNAFFKGWGLK